jgi:outer membrane lipoprotein carrier protein
MKRVIILFICILVPFIGKAQNPQQSDIIEQINKASAQMQSLECEFVQTKFLSILDAKMVSKGRMYYQQADKLRWEYTSPYTYTFILNQNQVLLKNDNRSDVIDVNQNRMFKEIARMMMNSIVGNCLSDDKSFKTTVVVSGTDWIATLIPIKRDMKQMWNKLVLHINPDLKVVYKVEMHEPSGDYTIIDLINIKTNNKINAEVFNIN